MNARPRAAIRQEAALTVGVGVAILVAAIDQSGLASLEKGTLELAVVLAGAILTRGQVYSAKTVHAILERAYGGDLPADAAAIVAKEATRGKSA